MEITEEIVSDVIQLIQDKNKDKDKNKWVMKINNEKINFSQIEVWTF